MPKLRLIKISGKRAGHIGVDINQLEFENSAQKTVQSKGSIAVC